MKNPLPPYAMALAAVAVLVLGWFAFVQVSKDPVETGTKTGYGPDKMPPPPTFTIPPMPQSANTGGPVTPPPPADGQRGG